MPTWFVALYNHVPSCLLVLVLVYVLPVSSGGSELDVQGSDAQLLAALGDVLGGQHGSVWRRLISVCLHLHTAGHSADRLPGNQTMTKKLDTGVWDPSEYILKKTQRMMTYFPERSVTWTKVSLKEAKMWQTPKTFSPSATWGPRLITCSSFFSLPLRGAIVWRGKK